MADENGSPVHGQTYTINEHGVCRRVTNNAALTPSAPTSDASQ
jgi:hypothetical protein